MNKLLVLINRSVFHGSTRGASMDSILATMFHRVSATMYLGFAAWAVVSAIYFMPDLLGSGEQGFRAILAIGVLVVSLPACFGATFWPSLARMEAFFGAGLVGVLIAYLWDVVEDAFAGHDSWRTVTTVLIFLIVPMTRWSIVVLFLVRQAKVREILPGEDR